MSIAKKGANKSSSGLLDYLLDEKMLLEKEPEVIGGNVIGTTKLEIAEEFREQEELNYKVKNKVSHFSISFPNNQKISNEMAADYADLLMERMGYQDNPYVVVRHYDKEKRNEKQYSHIHIAASRINNDGSLISEWKISDRLIEAVDGLNQEFGLDSTDYLKVKKDGDVKRRIKQNEYQMMQRTGKLSVIEEFKEVAGKALKEVNDLTKAKNEIQRSLFEPSKLEKFVGKLEENGFEVLPNINLETGEMKGFSFKKDKIIFIASRAAKDFKWSNLAEKTDYYEPRDQEFLKNLRIKVIENNQNIVIQEENVIARETDKSGKLNGNLIETKTIKEELEPQISKEHNEELNGLSTKIPFEMGIDEVEKNEKAIEIRVTGNESNKIREVGETELNFTKTASKLEKSSGSETDFDLEKVENFGGELTEIWSDRGSNEAIGSGEFVERNGKDDSAENRSFQANESKASDGIEQFTQPNLGFTDRNREFGEVQENVGGRDENIFESESKGNERLGTNEKQYSKTEETNIVGGEPRKLFDTGDTTQEQPELRIRKSEFENRKSEIESNQTTIKEGEKSISKPIETSSGEDKKTRKELGKLGGENAEDFGMDVSNADIGEPHSILSLGESSRYDGGNKFGNPQISGITEGENSFGESTTGINQTIRLHDNKTETDIPGGREILSTTTGETTEDVSNSRKQSQQTATAAVQIINVKYFAAGLEEKLINEWIKRVEANEPPQFLSEIITPQTLEEEKSLAHIFAKQVELLAKNLEVEIPQPIEILQMKNETTQNQLIWKLTELQVKNYEENKNLKLDEETVEVIFNSHQKVFTNKAFQLKRNINENKSTEKPYYVEMDSVEKMVLTIKDNDQLKLQKIFGEINSKPPNSLNLLEMKVFNALIKPQELKIDEKAFENAIDLVKKEKFAAQEATKLVQIAFGGQSEVFTKKVKEDLAKKIYQHPTKKASQIYNDLHVFDWRKTVDIFSSVVKKVGAENGHFILPIKSEEARNEFLAKYLTHKVVDAYEAKHKTISPEVKKSLFEGIYAAKNDLVREEQKSETKKIRLNDLPTPKFEKALDSSVHNWMHRDKKANLEKAVKAVVHVEHYLKQVQSEIIPTKGLSR